MVLHKALRIAFEKRDNVSNRSNLRTLKATVRTRRLRIQRLEERCVLSITVDTLIDEADGSIVDGDISLRDAIAAAMPGETIDFASSLTAGGPATINLVFGSLNTNRHLTVDKDLTIKGPGASLLTIKAYDPDLDGSNDRDGSRIFNVHDGNSIADKTVLIRDLTITGGDTSSAGGAIFSGEHLTIEACKITANSNDFNGVVYCSFGTLTIISSELRNNSGSAVSARSGLGVGSLVISESVITGNDFDGVHWWALSDVSISTSQITANGGQGIDHANSHLTLLASTISGNSAGAIRSLNSQRNGGVTIADSLITNNNIALASFGPHEGAISIRDGDLTITSSTISENSLSASGFDGMASGGGIHHRNGELTITSSTIVGNSVTAEQVNAYGGGIYHQNGSVTITSSTIDNNSVKSNGNGESVEGGGIFQRDGLLTIVQSTISSNSATFVSRPPSGYVHAHGGGIRIRDGELRVNSSTISGNSARAKTNGVSGTGTGGGISAVTSTLTITHSTIISNTATGISSASGGGGISGNATLNHTIVAGNRFGPGPDLKGVFTVRHSLIGDKSGTSLIEAPLGLPDANGNVIGGPTNGIIDPLLGPLADIGGLSMSHAMLPGSPAIDAGDLAAAAGVGGTPLYDQRGAPFNRVHDGDAVNGARIDIGAIESQPLPAAFFGDYNGDHLVDAADYVVWRNGIGIATMPYAGADGTGDGSVDQSDYKVWRANFGRAVVNTQDTTSALSVQVFYGGAEPQGSVTDDIATDRRAESSVQGQLISMPLNSNRQISSTTRWSARPLILHAESLDSTGLHNSRVAGWFQWQEISNHRSHRNPSSPLIDDSASRGTEPEWNYGAIDNVFEVLGATELQHSMKLGE
jgi:hypothetical protein